MSQKVRVLIVDDEEQFRVTTEKILSRRGFQTILAGSGEEAIARVKDKPDVIVLDIKMPGLDGLQTLAEIKKLAPDLPVIMLTGHGSEPSAQTALDQGAFDYLAKPCEIDIMVSKITEAYRHGRVEGPPQENRVREVMIPLADYTTLTGEATIKDAVDALNESFGAKVSASHIMETGHRSILILDQRGQLEGVLTILDLLRAIMPAYLSAPKPSMADSIQYSPMFWTGMFTREVRDLASKRIKEFMSPPPPTIDENANLMEAAYAMVKDQARRLAVVRGNQVVGVIREQDLFFEMERLFRK